MIASLAVFAAVALLTPWLTRLLGRRVFPVIALVPAGVFVVLLTWLPGVVAGRPVVEEFSWIPQLGISLSFRLDPLALLLALIVTGIGALVLLYCTHYFDDDEPALGRFAGLLLAFAGVMLGLVTADDVFLLFTFWEATSVLSYLLIGHYTGRKESRGAALQALTVTTFGGLAMLVGLVVLAVAGGTSSLSELVADPVTGAAGEWGIGLVLVGAISKSALVPFHFWLPAAMAAPTPVSAYLHAAAMVKAGVYLVARLAPGYADLSVWHPIVIGLGVLTMVVGGWRALRQYDLKLLLAYGTVSQLGFLVLVTGFGTRDAALAGVALLLAHALFKATLFLVVGIVDHAAGTRDWRKLSGLGRRMPVIATVAFVAAASMAGVPPLIGFIAKEAVFSAFLEGIASGDGWAWAALIGAFAGSVLTVAYTVRFVWGAFFTRPDVEATPLQHVSRAIGIAPAILAAASLVSAFAVTLIEPLLSAYADELPGPQEYHLALWHGLEPALAVSAGVFALGAVLVWARQRVARIQAGLSPMFDSARGYLGTVSVVDRVAAAVTTAIQHQGLPGYLAIIVAVFIGGLGTATFMNTDWPSGIRLMDFPAQPFIAVVMGIAAIAAATVRQRVTAVLLVSELKAGLVPGPVDIILWPGQRPVDAGGRHFEPIAALDRVGILEERVDLAGNRLAIGQRQLPSLGPLGHDLQRRVGRAAGHRHAHEIEAQFLDGGLDQSGNRSSVGHASLQTGFGPAPGWEPASASMTMSRREGRYRRVRQGAQAKLDSATAAEPCRTPRGRSGSAGAAHRRGKPGGPLPSPRRCWRRRHCLRAPAVPS